MESENHLKIGPTATQPKSSEFFFDQISVSFLRPRRVFGTSVSLFRTLPPKMPNKNRKPKNGHEPSTPSKAELYARLARDQRARLTPSAQTDTPQNTTQPHEPTPHGAPYTPDQPNAAATNGPPTILLDAPPRQDEDELAELNAKVGALEAQLREAEADVNSARAEADAVRAEATATLESELARARAHASEQLAAALAEAEAKLQTMHSAAAEELKFARAAGAATAADAEKERAAAAELRADLAACKLELTESRTGTEAALAEAASLRAATEAARVATEAARAEQAAARADLEAARAETAAARKASAHAEALSEELKASVAKLQHDLQRTYEAREKELTEKLDAMLEAVRAESDLKIRDANGMAERMTQEVASVRAELESAKSKADVAENARLEHAAEEASARAVLEKRAFRAEARMEAMETDLASERDKLAVARDELTSCEEMLAEREEELLAAEEALSVLAPDAVQQIQQSVAGGGPDGVADPTTSDVDEAEGEDGGDGEEDDEGDDEEEIDAKAVPRVASARPAKLYASRTASTRDELMVEKIANWAIGAANGDSALTNPTIFAETVASKSEVVYQVGEQVARDAPSAMASVMDFMNDWRGAIKDMGSDIGDVLAKRPGAEVKLVAPAQAKIVSEGEAAAES